MRCLLRKVYENYRSYYEKLPFGFQPMTSTTSTHAKHYFHSNRCPQASRHTSIQTCPACQPAEGVFWMFATSCSRSPQHGRSVVLKQRFPDRLLQAVVSNIDCQALATVLQPWRRTFRSIKQTLETRPTQQVKSRTGWRHKVFRMGKRWKLCFNIRKVKSMP